MQPRRRLGWTSARAIAAVAALTASGCFAFDWDYRSGAGGSAGATGTSSTGGGGSGGGPCHFADACPAKQACSIGSCKDGACVFAPAPVDTTCGSGKICDSAGDCVIGGGAISSFGFVGSPGPTPLGLAIASNGSLSLLTSGAGNVGSIAVSGTSLVSVDAVGHPVAGLSLGSADPHAVAVQASTVYVGGSFGSGTVIGMTPLDASGGFVAAVKDGACQWLTTFGGSGSTAVTSIAIGPNGDLTVVGTFSGSLTVNGVQKYPSAGHAQIFVARFTGSEPTWLAPFGLSDFMPSQFQSVAVDAAGNAFLAGTFSGTVKFKDQLFSPAGMGPAFYLTKLSSTGQPVWDRLVTTAADTGGRSVAVNTKGDVGVFGWSSDAITIGNRSSMTGGAFLGLYDTDGNVIGGNVFPSPQSGTEPIGAFDIGFDPFGNLAVAGSLYGSMDLGLGTLTSAGSEDLFVAKFGTDLRPVWAARYGDSSLQQGIALAETQGGDTWVAGFIEGSINFGKGPISTSTQTGVLVELGP